VAEQGLTQTTTLEPDVSSAYVGAQTVELDGSISEISSQKMREAPIGLASGLESANGNLLPHAYLEIAGRLKQRP
jgi:hypothetical protein